MEEEIQFVWKEPPPKVTKSVWAERLVPLRERPGEWAMIRTSTPSRVSGLAQRLAKLPALGAGFEFRTHRASDKKAELYARYVIPPARRRRAQASSDRLPPASPGISEAADSGSP